MKFIQQLLHNRRIVTVACILVFIASCIVSAYFGNMNALLHTSFRHVTTEQLASAMRQDYYYSYYRENTVLFSAHVADVYGSTVQFATNDSYSVSCIINPSKDIKAGDILRIAAEAYGAERLTQGLLFKQCEVL